MGANTASPFLLETNVRDTPSERRIDNTTTISMEYSNKMMSHLKLALLHDPTKKPGLDRSTLQVVLAEKFDNVDEVEDSAIVEIAVEIAKTSCPIEEAKTDEALQEEQ